MKRREKFEEMNGGGMEEILGVNLRHKSTLVHRTCASTACFQIWYTRSGKPRLPISSTVLRNLPALEIRCNQSQLDEGVLYTYRTAQR